MQDLRDTDGSATHRKAIRFHTGKCRGGLTALHLLLRDEGTAVYLALKDKTRAHEDAEDDLADATAEVDTTEIAFENAIRDLDADLVSLDREDPTKNARLTVFPDGFGAVIEPEGDKQLEVLPALHVRLKPFKGEPTLLGALQKLSAAEDSFKLALQAEESASEAAASAFEEERGARAKVREQLRSAHGRLRDLYRARPAQAEQFFLKLGRKEGKAKASTAPAAPGGGAPGAGGGGTPPGG